MSQTDRNETPFRYTPALANEIEARWQERWEAEGTFRAPNPTGDLAPQDPAARAAVAEQPKIMIQDMFPYPSGAGLHVGHPLGFIATDVYARFQRTTGCNVLYTMGFDAFGLPAEQFAVQTGQHPRTTTEANIETYQRQLRQLGLSHDDQRAFATIDPAYYRWTQWIFLQVYNSWYDPEAPGRRPDTTGRARPIAELEAAYAAGEVETPDGRPWAELTEAERADAVDARRLAYLSDAPVNWVPGLGTVVANEEVTAEGRSERGNFPVFQRNLPQWMMRITAYADRLVDDLDRLQWPESVASMQRNWIGRSHGAEVSFDLALPHAAQVDGATEGNPHLRVFTTRPDTIFGATFMVVAPEHPVAEAAPAQWPEGTKESWTGGHATPRKAVEAYRLAASRKTELERQADEKAKTGVFTGVWAVNPVTGQQLPVFVADYVMMGYGTGAIMAVPAQDQRDWDFARSYELDIVRTVQPPEGHDEETAFTGEGPAINSATDAIDLDGMGVAEAKAAMIAHLEEIGAGRGTTSYKLRDWLFSRQRYWGEPFPIVWDEDGRAHAVPEDQLPVELPEVADYSPRTYDPEDWDTQPESPLGRNEDWVNVTLDLGDGPKRYRRETNTMPNWAGSCWYELRYVDPTNDETLVDPVNEEYWMGPGRGAGAGVEGDPGGVDLYVGGVEHAVLHLLYARFWHKVLFDLGHVSSDEPFRRLFNQGYVQAYAFRDHRGQPVPATEVTEREAPEDPQAQDGIVYEWNGQRVTREYGKMGKSLKNVVTPDEMCEQYGADVFRVYEMSMGPLDASRPWDTRAVVGSQRFLQRLWRAVVDEATGELRVVEDAPDEATLRALHGTIAGVAEDYRGLRFNTAVAKLIELTNTVTKLDAVPRAVAEPLVQMVAPLAPHLGEELWSRLGHERSLATEPFPQADEEYLAADTVTCVVQVRGKVRARLEVAPDITAEELEAQALATDRVQELLDGAEIRKVIVKAPKLVNIVV
ncbi:leucyl-tRNA synthetase [Kytococcus aerolatus]|uniref:Leucine--tRNA ligase n=1 Tax=Kytococcus aerolatus TaxID=592308 RepID=A0A212T673_9MICO|nr:leucine--tRNA ligase [Kytococcus aerolatus]SNC61274.1 leucyl-tRNA synthetase [Kytococcus aerolatus]